MRPAPDILCIGSCHWDIIGRTPSTMRIGADLPGRISRQPGGVALNIATTLGRLGLRPAILTAVGRDADGEALLIEIAGMGVVSDFVYRSDDLPTDRYMAVEDGDGLVAAIADARSLEAAGENILRPLEDGRLGSPTAPWLGPVAIDGNLTAELITRVASSPLLARADLRVAPASPEKAERLAPLLDHPGATIYLNLDEARVLGHDDYKGSEHAARGLVARGARRVLVTDGARPASDADAAGGVTLIPPAVTVTRVTGAGDTFMAVHIVAERDGAGREAALVRALKAAAQFVAGEAPT